MRPSGNRNRNRGPKDSRKAREDETLAFLVSVGQGNSPQAQRLRGNLSYEGDERRDAHRQRQGRWASAKTDSEIGRRAKKLEEQAMLLEREIERDVK